MLHITRRVSLLNRRTTLQILFNFLSVSSIEALKLLVEPHVPLVDVVDVVIVVVNPPPRVLLSLGYLLLQVLHHVIDVVLSILVKADVDGASRRVESLFSHLLFLLLVPLRVHLDTFAQPVVLTEGCVLIGREANIRVLLTLFSLPSLSFVSSDLQQLLPVEIFALRRGILDVKRQDVADH